MASIDDLQEVAAGIFYTKLEIEIVSASRLIVAHLRTAAESSPKRRARLCAHPEPDAEQQDMLIVSHRETYVPPHRHLTKSETMLVIDGLAHALVFEDDGTLAETVPMGPLTSGRTFFYRMPAMRFHGLSIETEFLTYFESTKGPFRKADSEDAIWAPAADQVREGRNYIAELFEQTNL
jgi:cupin fold WbuC family metalloprotein